MVTGRAAHYVSSGPDNLGLPRARPGLAKAHEQRPRKPLGLDFDALAPTCQGCGKRSGSVQYASMLCHRCRTPETPSGADIARAERNRQIAEGYTAGESMEKLARRLHVGLTTIRATLREQGIERRPLGRPRVAKAPKPARVPQPRGRFIDEAVVVVEYQAGDSAPTIAARHGVVPRRIRMILVRRGVEMRDDRARNSGGRNAKTLADYDLNLVTSVVDLYGSGLTIKEVSDALGKSTRLVDTILHKAGVEMRAKGRRAS